MSIDWLRDLERDIMYGKHFYAVPTAGKNQWVISQEKDSLKSIAERTAAHKKIPVDIVRLVLPTEAVSGETYLVPIRIGGQDVRGEAVLEWVAVETIEASELMRDLRFGESPYFGMQIVETIVPKDALIF
ncbi:MAG: hypothetical protein ACOX3T_03970 [Bdellovibrionota bacterium]